MTESIEENVVTTTEIKTSSITVNISDAKISADPDTTLTTYSLGSCIGVCLYDAAMGMAGLLHYQLPTSTMDAKRAQEQPLMFADTGLAALVGSMEAHGASSKRMKVTLAGGAEMLGDSKMFSIGRRNYTAIRKILWQRGMLIEKEDIGGTAPRTVYLHVADGSVVIKSNGDSYGL